MNCYCLMLLLLFFCCLARMMSAPSSGLLQPQRDILAIEKSLQYNAQKKCGKEKAYTSIDRSFTYAEYLSADIVRSSMTKIRSLNISRVILAPPSKNHIVSSKLHRPLSYTFASRNFGSGIMNGTPSAIKWASIKKPSIYLPLTHPMQNRSNCIRLASQASENPGQFYKDNDSLQSGAYQYLAIVHNAVIHRDGLIALPCGWLQQRSGCAMRTLSRGRGWWKSLIYQIKCSQISEPWSSVFRLQEALNTSLPIIDEVFIIDTQWDFNYHHWMLQAVPRLMRYLKFLRANPSVKIHVMKEELYHNYSGNSFDLRRLDAANWLREQVLVLLGISSSRLVHGSVIARKVYMPREMECADFLKHSLELKFMAKILKRKISHYKCTRNFIFEARRSDRAKTVLLQERLCNPDTPSVWRCFNESSMLKLAKELHSRYPDYNIEFTEEIRDYNKTNGHELACSFQQYHRADITIGVHGAAMTNIMFLKPGGIVLEIVGVFDGRFPPVCGLFGPLAAVFGLHSYIYYFDALFNTSYDSGESAFLNHTLVVDEFTEFYHYLGKNNIT